MFELPHRAYPDNEGHSSSPFRAAGEHRHSCGSLFGIKLFDLIQGFMQSRREDVPNKALRQLDGFGPLGAFLGKRHINAVYNLKRLGLG